MKILIIAAQGIGNTLLAIPMLKCLRKAYPNSQIDLLTINSVKKLFRNCPYIDKIYVIDKKVQRNFFSNVSTLFRLRQKRYDASIMTIPAAQPHFNILAAIIGAKKRITHNYKKNLVWLQNKLVPIRLVHDIEQNLNLLKVIKVSGKGSGLELWLKNEEKIFADKFIKKFKEESIIGMHPGTSVSRRMTEKRWPLRKFAEVADGILEKKNARVLVFLGPDDKPLEKIKNFVMEENKDRISIIKEEKLRKMAAMIGKCKLFISNDSGLMHIAASLNVPTAAIFVSTDYRRTAPLGKKHLVLKKDETYKAFRQSIEELSGIKTNWRKETVKQLTVEDVMNAIKRKLI